MYVHAPYSSAMTQTGKHQFPINVSNRLAASLADDGIVFYRHGLCLVNFKFQSKLCSQDLAIMVMCKSRQ